MQSGFLLILAASRPLKVLAAAPAAPLLSAPAAAAWIAAALSSSFAATYSTILVVSSYKRLRAAGSLATASPGVCSDVLKALAVMGPL